VSNGQLTGLFQVSAAVASSTKLLKVLLSHLASRSTLYISGYEHFVISNVVVAVMANEAHTRLPPMYEKRVRAAVDALERDAAANART
jgi:hypothetical protein